MKEKACKVCGTAFTPLRSMQKVCGAPCAIQHAVECRDKNRAKAERIARQESRKVIRLAKEKAKRRADWLREAQSAFNRYIRLRDEKEPCISCGRHHEGQYHAGHYLSTGARPELRFDERNVHKQCQPCNTHLHGNLVLYRKALIEKYGVAVVEWLEGPHEAKKYSIEDLKAIKDKYNRMAKEIFC